MATASPHQEYAQLLSFATHKSLPAFLDEYTHSFFRYGHFPPSTRKAVTIHLLLLSYHFSHFSRASHCCWVFQRSSPYKFFATCNNSFLGEVSKHPISSRSYIRQALHLSINTVPRSGPCKVSPFILITSPALKLGKHFPRCFRYTLL